MIPFFRDILDGPLYFIVLVISIILIMAIIGFIMERKQLEKQEKEKRVVVGSPTPIEPVKTREVVLNTKEEPKAMKHQTHTQDHINNNTIDVSMNQDTMHNRSDVQVNKKAAKDKQEEVKEENVVQVIDFGSTKDVKVDNKN